jgi:hypothetical protein
VGDSVEIFDRKVGYKPGEEYYNAFTRFKRKKKSPDVSVGAGITS